MLEQKSTLKVFISFCGSDRSLKNTIKERLFSLNNYFKAKDIVLEVIEMDTHCSGDWASWMIDAIDASDCFVPIITENILHADVEKRVYEEIVEARNRGKIRIPFIVSDEELPSKFRANLNGTSEVRVRSDYLNLNEKLDELVNKVKISLDNVCNGENQADILPDYLQINDDDSFVGREKEMQEIKEILEKNNVVILHGEGGIGKTSLAKHFFLTHKDLYSKAYLLSSPNGIKDSIGNLHLNNVYSSSKSLEERYNDNLKQMSALSEKTILIMDNCDCGVTQEELNHIRNLHCRFIITSRPSFDSEYIVKKIGPMEDEDLIRLVYKKYPSIEKDNDKSKEEVEKLLKNLFEYAGRHTLTIEMAASIMNSGDLSIEEITNSLLEVTETCKTAHTDKKNTIYERLSTLYNLVDLTEEEMKVLHALTLISPINGIKRKELKKLLNLQDNNAINHLIENTLIKFDEENKIVNLHPLFSDVLYKKENIKDLFEENKEIIEWIIDFCVDDKDISTKKAKKEYCEYVLNKREEILSNKKDIRFQLLLNLTDLYRDLSDIISAIETCKKAIEISQDNIIALADLYTNLGWLYLNNSEFDEAYNSLMRALDLHKEIYKGNEEHLALADAYNNLGVLCKDIGRFEESEDYYKKSLVIKNKVFKDQPHQSMALTYNNLGYLYREMRQYNDAQECILKALEIQKHYYNDDLLRPEVALTYNLLGLVSRDLKEFKQAEEYYKKSLEIRLNIYKDDPNHFDLATTYNNLGLLYKDLKRFDSAIIYLQKSLAIKQIIYKNNVFHPWIANTYHNLGLTYFDMEDYVNAEKCYLEALYIRKTVFKANPNHPSFALLNRDLGILYLKQNRYEEAIEQLLASENCLKANKLQINLKEVYLLIKETYSLLNKNDKVKEYSLKIEELN